MLEDILTEGLSVVFCGINPGLLAAEQGHHFAGRSNRFWRTLHLAGFTPVEVAPENDRSILHYQCGLTAVVDRPTPGGSTVSAGIQRSGGGLRAQDQTLCTALCGVSRQGCLCRLVREKSA